jgi:hypothetical protein
MDGNQAVFVLLFFNGIEVRSRCSRRTKDTNAQSSGISNVYLAMRLGDIPSPGAEWYQVRNGTRYRSFGISHLGL